MLKYKKQMEEHMKITLDVNKVYDCDLLVCGGGVSGISTAISAGRSGLNVILIESGNCLGGTATEGLVGPFMTCYDVDGKEQIIKGLFDDIVNRLIEKGGAVHSSKCRGSDAYSAYRWYGHVGVTPFNAETLKRVAEEMCLENGVKILYHTTLVDCATENNEIKCVYAYGGEQLIRINAKTFADCTGKAILAKKAGAEVYFGDENGEVQPSSLFFTVKGVDKEMLDENAKNYLGDGTTLFHMKEVEKARAEGKFSSGTLKTRLFMNSDGETWTVNMAQENDGFDQFSAEGVTNAEISQRKQVEEIFEFLKTLPPYKNIKLVKMADKIGVRESRRMRAVKQFTLADIESGEKHADRIAKCSNSVDVHLKHGSIYTEQKRTNYYIPLSCMISKDFTNLMGVGKCIDADKFAFGAVRVMTPCIAMGHAAGITLAKAVKENKAIKDVNVLEVQKDLVKQGAIID